MEEFAKNTNLEIYSDLVKYNWFRKEFPVIESFDYESFDTGKSYFKYLNLKNNIDDNFILLKKSKLTIFIRLSWFVFWMIAIYKSISWSGWVSYFLIIFVLSGYLIILGKGLWKNESLKISEEGCEVDGTTKIVWEDITNFITVPYRFDNKFNFIVYGCIILKNGVLYKIPISNYLFATKEQKVLLPIYVEYFKEKWQLSKLHLWQ